MNREQLIEHLAKAAAKSDGWDKWDTAEHIGDNLNGNNPDEERIRYRERTVDMLAAIDTAGFAIMPRIVLYFLQ